MKHYIGDDGIFQYGEVKHAAHIGKSESFWMYPNSKDFGATLRSDLLEAAYRLLHTYDIVSSLGETGLGGCRSFKQWRTDEETDQLENLLKPIFLDFLDAGYPNREFPLYVWDLACKCLFTLELGDCDNEDET